MKVKYELSPEDVKRAIREYLGLGASASVTFNISNDFTDYQESSRSLKFEGAEIEDEAKDQIKKRLRTPIKKRTLPEAPGGPSQLELLGH